MKKLFIMLVAIAAMGISKEVAAQGTCTIHLFSKGWASTIKANDVFLVGLNKDEALEYTVPAKGRITLMATFADNFSTTVTVDTEKDSDVYIIIYEMVYPMRLGKNKIVNEKEWNKESKNFKSVVTMDATGGN